MEVVDVYWSFRSPYSYLATPGMLALKQDYDIDLVFRVVLPIAVRAPETLFNEQNRHRALYIGRDWSRRAQFLGMSDKWPRPDPIVQNGMDIPEDQPYIYRLSALGVEAQRRGKGVEFAFEVSHLLFGGTQDWHEGDHLAKAAERAGLDFEAMEAAIADGDQLQEIEANQDKLDAAGHWGVPTFVVRNEPFFGQDRIDTLRWRLDQYGLKNSS